MKKVSFAKCVLLVVFGFVVAMSACKKDEDDNGEKEEQTNNQDDSEDSGKDEEEVVFDASAGVLPKAIFAVSASKTVVFSQGNLQYNANNGKTHKTATGIAAGTWRFAAHQYDCIGEANSKISEDYEGWIDLFGRATSGWNSGVEAYQPWFSSSSNVYYLTSNLVDNYANADWGVFNAISNGGDVPGKWRTLTADEWCYLFQKSTWTLAKIKGTLCFLLFPAGFVAPDGLSVSFLSTGTTQNFKSKFDVTIYAGNVYSAEQFALLEEAGVVALPCAGWRSGKTLYSVENNGCYWSSSSASYGDAYYFIFKEDYMMANLTTPAYTGNSVRLVRDVED